ncbi:TPA: carbohydrate ABC transporter permease [bacterium]|nr:carbohydrate ABC transporter permease [bacterium]
MAFRKNKQKTALRDTKGDKIFYIVNAFIMILLAIIVIYPMYFILIASISDPDAIFNGEVYLLPVNITFKGYERLFSDRLFWIGYRNTIIYVVVGTTLNILMTIPTGWALSRKELPGRKYIMWFFIITLFFGGGLIPFYLLVSKLGMVDSPLALIIPSALSVWNAFMTKAYYESNIPQELLEAAEIDGANEFKTFLSIIIPISKPIIAVMILFYAVGHWNSYFNALIFISSEEYYPLQLVLKDILIATEVIGGPAGDAATIIEQNKIANQIKYSSIIVSSLPIILLYPVIQKFFNKGILVGSFK